MNSKELGILGEKIAKQYLENKGYKILETNFFYRIPGSPWKGEIDIIASKGGVLSFVEVKTGKLTNYAETIEPEDRFNAKKKRQIIKTAQIWMGRNKIELDSKQRIDVASVKIDLKNWRAKVKYFENV